MSTAIDISFVIPVYNEEETITTLAKQIQSVVKKEELGVYEIIFVDDGSRDKSWDVIEKLHDDDPQHIKALHFRRNFGKADALAAGFGEATGKIVFTLDADLQDDPEEIPNFIKMLEEENLDMISGWKKTRHDPLSKTLPSRLFNAVTCAVSGLKLHDFNCGFKCYRREVVQHVRLYGELHRFIPVLAHAEGFLVGEIAVKHHPRRHGVSKYGMSRLIKGFIDLMTVVLTTRYLQRPAHLFGGLGTITGVGGFCILAYLSMMKLIAGVPIGNRPLFFLGILLLLLAAQMVSLGLVAELIQRNTRAQRRQERISRKLG